MDLNKPPALLSGIVDAQGDMPKGTLFVISKTLSSRWNARGGSKGTESSLSNEV